MEKKGHNSFVSGIKDSLLERMKRDKRFELAVYGVLVAAGILLCTAVPLFGNNKTETELSKERNTIDPVFSIKTMETEARLEEALSCIRGAGKVEVMLTVAAADAPAMDVAEDGNKGLFNSIGTSLNDSAGAMTNEGETLQREGMEEICGVIVIAEGAGMISVRMDLLNAVKTVLGIDASCIEVFEMKPIE